MRAPRTSNVLFQLGLILTGCGYGDYIDRSADTLATMEYEEKVESVLGPKVDLSAKGIVIRLPRVVDTQPVPMENLSARFAGIFNSPPDSNRPMRVVIATSYDTLDAKMSTLDELTAELLDPSSIEQWMGPGVEPLADVLRRESRELKAGPRLRLSKQHTIPVKMTTLKQMIDVSAGDTSVEANDAALAPKTETYVWKFFFLDDAGVIAMVGYRVRQDDYVGEFADAIDMSIATARLVAPPVRTPGEGTPDAGAAPRRR